MWFKPNRENWSENMSRYTPGMCMFFIVCVVVCFLLLAVMISSLVCVVFRDLKNGNLK